MSNHRWANRPSTHSTHSTHSTPFQASKQGTGRVLALDSLTMVEQKTDPSCIEALRYDKMNQKPLYFQAKIQKAPSSGASGVFKSLKLPANPYAGKYRI